MDRGTAAFVAQIFGFCLALWGSLNPGTGLGFLGTVFGNLALGFAVGFSLAHFFDFEE